MCTVSVIRPEADRLRAGAFEPTLLRVVVNRDERDSRPAAWPVRIAESGGVRAMLPVDPAGDGTWVAASDAGLVFALLNGPDANVGRVFRPGGASDAGRALRPGSMNRFDPGSIEHVDAGPNPRLSRGQIIRSLIGCADIDEVMSRLRSLDLDAFRPWRLVVAGEGVLLRARPGRRGVRLSTSLLPSRFMTSVSSLDPARAWRLRRDAFRLLVTQPDAAAQDAFHEHRWPADPELSVRMTRCDSRTVSRTVVEVTASEVRMSYALLPSSGELRYSLALPRPAAQQGAA
jgi:hypothetical protein